MTRPRIQIASVLCVAIVFAGIGALARDVPPPWTSLSRAVDDHRNAVAKPEVRDGAEEQDEQEEKAGAPIGPALADAVPARAIEPWSFFASPAAHIDASQPHRRPHVIRGPPR